MSLVESTSNYTIYKTTTGDLLDGLSVDLKRALLDLIAPRHNLNSVEILDLFRTVRSSFGENMPLKINILGDAVAFSGVVCSYGTVLMSDPHMLIASMSCHPRTPIYQVLYHKRPDQRYMFDIDMILDLIDAKNIELLD